MSALLGAVEVMEECRCRHRRRARGVRCVSVFEGSRRVAGKSSARAISGCSFSAHDMGALGARRHATVAVRGRPPGAGADRAAGMTIHPPPDAGSLDGDRQGDGDAAALDARSAEVINAVPVADGARNSADPRAQPSNLVEDRLALPCRAKVLRPCADAGQSAPRSHRPTDTRGAELHALALP